MSALQLNISIDHNLEKLINYTEQLPLTTQLFILTDSNTREHCLNVLHALSPRLKEAIVIEIPAGEKNKNAENLFFIAEKLANFAANKNSVLINLGGGVICDIGAFAASIYKRGIGYIHVPTSLLAQLDASIGGKNGIDFLHYKNLIGLISFPNQVFISKQFLNTLPQAEMRSGIAEALKHGLIADKMYWDFIKRDSFKNIEQVLEKSISIKSSIVLQDPYEKNIRKKLNAGHTAGHAIESWKLETENPIMHGDAVAAGLVIESYMSMRLGHLPKTEFEEIKNVISSIFPKVDMKNYSTEDMLQRMSQDKKNHAHKISFSLIRKIGNASIDDYCENDLIAEAFEYYSKNCPDVGRDLLRFTQTITLQKNADFKYGEVDLPTSKSLSNRALIIQALCQQPFAIGHLSDSDDTNNLIEQLSSSDAIKDVGSAGTNMRFLISLLAITPGDYILTGNERMQQRPVAELVDCLKSLEAAITYKKNNGFPPLEISGKKLSGGKVKIDGSISSQFISSLLMIAPCLEKGLEIEIQGNVVSRSYIDMTLGLMNYFGIKTTINQNTITIPPQTYHAKDYEVEKDWSSAAFWYGLISHSPIGTKILFINLSLNSLQGDRKAVEYFKFLGVSSTEQHNGILIEKTENKISNLDIDLIDEPDLFPVLAFSCASLAVCARFTGLKTLNLKESKRIEAVKTELEETGAITISGDDYFEITEYNPQPPNLVFDTYNDHRMAMAAAVFMQPDKQIIIHGSEVASKSYPDFFEHLKSTGIVNNL